MTKGIHIAKKSPMGEKPIGQILIEFYQIFKNFHKAKLTSLSGTCECVSDENG